VNISITLDCYGHLMPGNDEEAAGMLEADLERSTEDTARAAEALAWLIDRSPSGILTE